VFNFLPIRAQKLNIGHMTHMNRLYNIFLYSHIRTPPHVGWVERFLRNPSTKNKRMETTHYLINRLCADGFRTSTHPTEIKAHLFLRRMGRALFAKPINQKQTHGNNALFDKPALY